MPPGMMILLDLPSPTLPYYCIELVSKYIVTQGHRGAIPGHFKQRLQVTRPLGWAMNSECSFGDPSTPSPGPTFLNMDLNTQKAQTLHLSIQTNSTTAQTTMTKNILHFRWELKITKSLRSQADLGGRTCVCCVCLLCLLICKKSL